MFGLIFILFKFLSPFVAFLISWQKDQQAHFLHLIQIDISFVNTIFGLGPFKFKFLIFNQQIVGKIHEWKFTFSKVSGVTHRLQHLSGGHCQLDF